MLFVQGLKKKNLLKMLQLLTVFVCLQCAGSVCVYVYVYVRFSIKTDLLRRMLWLKKKERERERLDAR